MKNKTTITIAHRIETIKNSDMINVFEKGEIVERGTYEELLKLKGFFYNLERGTQFVWSFLFIIYLLIKYLYHKVTISIITILIK